MSNKLPTEEESRRDKETFDNAMEYYLVFGEYPDWYKKYNNLEN